MLLSKLSISSLFFVVFSLTSVCAQQTKRFPFEQEGLTITQAAAHLLNRFTYGAKPGQVDEVVNMGLEKWFEQQLNGGLPDDSLQLRIAGFDALSLSNTEVIRAFPKPLQVLRMAAADGIIPKDSVMKIDNKTYRERLAAYIKQKNIRQQADFFRQFIDQRILRAAYSNNQLQEVLTGFWFNHFNVSMTKKTASLFIPSYERDAIRPYITGKFEDMLMATAKSPAMLLYLDNFSSTANSENLLNPKKQQSIKKLSQKDTVQNDPAKALTIQKLKRVKANQGLNENYAREVMELHTLGVDGGYTQKDVTEAARILTGWTIYPIEQGYNPSLRRLIDAVGEQQLIDEGYVREGDFMFALNHHDYKEKTVLGKRFPALQGYQEGITLLKLLAHHPSTATFISRKLATYFVADDPPQSLINKMAQTFTEKEGNIKAVLMTMVYAPEFWNKNTFRAKIKSPFELAISAVRALDANVEYPYQLYGRMDKMGQKIYYYQAPTGFPDKAQYWINTGALLNRMNFGLDIATQRLRGVQVDLLKLNHYHEPESAADALNTYAALLMPGRDMGPTIKRLAPLLTQQGLDQKLEAAVKKISGKNKETDQSNDLMVVENDLTASPPKAIKKNNRELTGLNMLAQVVGIILGSPEFQRK